jgi:DMSO reductase family type II enzyme molybdopterin subunit
MPTLKPDETKAATSQRPYRSWQDLYREKWTWDGVYWGSHCVDCYPGNCPYRVYVKDGIVVREEPAGTFQTIERGVPDMNPMGCQKGAAWSQLLYAPERVLHPLRRAGERGEGKWQRISWDEALTELADAFIDAIEECGPESIIYEGSAGQGGMMAGMHLSRLMTYMGGITTDVNAVINDFSPGIYITFGKFNPASSNDDAFHAKFVMFTHFNPVYTMIPSYHFMAEARYNGAEIALVAPDCSPSHVHTDYYVPIRPGTDAALALGMAQTIISENLHKADFVREQTDLPLLVRLDTRKFLRGSDVQADGRDDQFYFFDERSGQVAEAPRATLALGDVEPALEGRYSARLADGTEVDVTPAFEILKEKLQDYTPEKASEMCGVHPDVIRMLARKVATKTTAILNGGTSFKYYHADLQVRAYILVMGLTGNWGKKGTGPIEWSTGMFDGPFIFAAKSRGGLEETQNLLRGREEALNSIRAEDPTRSEEMVGIEMMVRAMQNQAMVPPAFFWYYHCGYRDNWNRPEWNDPTMARPFDDYMREALDKGWWQGVARPGGETEPRVYIECGGNSLRRTRGGQTQLLPNLWPKLKKIVTIDWRMHATGMYSDLFLPVAHHYEKVTFHIPTPHLLNLTFSDRAAHPPADTLPEFEIFRRLAAKIAERARARGINEYSDNTGSRRSLESLYDTFTLGRDFEEAEQVAEEWVRDSVACGSLPKGTDLDTLRERGYVRFVDWGVSPLALNQAADLKPDEAHAAFRWHTEKKVPYPTLTRRAQFYIDHDWFLEAGEELPTHKENPKMGGDFPFVMTSGHNRWSIHSMNVTNRIMQETHRGRPHMVMNNDDALARGIQDEEEVRVFNDMGSFLVPVKLSPSVMPGQVIVYNGWEPLQFREWKGSMDVEPGMIKWLHLAGGYGHFRYWGLQWQPAPIDRAVHVDVAKLDG